MRPLAFDWSLPFFDGFASLLNVAISVLFIYPALILLIRLSGKRAVSKMNNFDWIVTVAIGAVAASAMVFDSVTITDALLAIALLLGLQWVVTKAMMRSERIADLLISRPTLLVHDGRILRDALRRERVTEAELFASIRQAGLSDAADCYAVVLESNADMTVVPAGEHGRPGAAMADVPALSDAADGTAWQDGPPDRG